MKKVVKPFSTLLCLVKNLYRYTYLSFLLFASTKRLCKALRNISVSGIYE